MLMRASGKKRASDMSGSGTNGRAPFSPGTPKKSQTASQNAPGACSDQACSASVSGKELPARSAAKARKAVIAACATRSGEGVQIGRRFEA